MNNYTKYTILHKAWITLPFVIAALLLWILPMYSVELTKFDPLIKEFALFVAIGVTAIILFLMQRIQHYGLLCQRESMILWYISKHKDVTRSIAIEALSLYPDNDPFGHKQGSDTDNVGTWISNHYEI